MSIKADKVLDCQGLSCPMPIVRTKKAIEELQPGQVLEIQATDRGSLADLQGWAKSTGHHYLGTKEEGDVLIHYVRKADPGEVKPETKFPHVIPNEELAQKLNQENITVLDVREPAEYAFGHIPGARSIPLGELEDRLQELNPEETIYVVCRTGNRSDMAAKILADKGFKQVFNVVPGMSEWNGPTEKEI
ncbi:SirA-like domain-containing protein [Caldalkalibacillus thermarum TA2.A1]|uniref:SirA-like domain-containing protein n=1 Tax=Caldalkalibacillus thermarum (strain TA2.A1) TaxID=986075 RepID=F5L8L1_CALTT|nr:sulfurtransferase TusA family protein [Caldalkalibacillus thermarum]EGL82350.1 SirA-like domain-containing protein [Caldalkalibacillus thermarum TA2.A1]